MWKNLIWGRELIRKGSRWRISIGQSVSICNDYRVPSRLGPKFIYSLMLGNEALVAPLILNDSVLRLDMITSCFIKVKGKAINEIPISGIHHLTYLFGLKTKLALSQ